MTSDDPRAPTSLEREALRHAIALVPEAARREALLRQLDALGVALREFTGAGFYTHFTCPDELRSDALSDADPPRLFLHHPNGRDVLDFVVYVKDGAIDVLEGASPGMWYEAFAAAGLWPDSDEPVVFDPARITR